MCRRAQHQFVRAGPSMRAHHDDIALQAFGRPRNLLVWPSNRHVEGDDLDRSPYGAMVRSTTRRSSLRPLSMSAFSS